MGAADFVPEAATLRRTLEFADVGRHRTQGFPAGVGLPGGELEVEHLAVPVGVDTGDDHH